jgi:hypothetical protein
LAKAALNGFCAAAAAGKLLKQTTMDVFPLISIHELLQRLPQRREGLVVQLEGGGIESLPSINGEELQVK